MAITHATKKVITRASTSKKSINKGINQEFVDSRRRLDDISESIKSLSKSIHSSRQVWTAVAKHQREFSKSLAASFPKSGNVQSHANEVEHLLRNLQESLMTDDSKDAPHQRIVNVLDKYLELLKSIESEYKTVETAYTEKARYERKVDKLEKKRSKKTDKLKRNIQKMNDAQKKLDEKIDQILIRMRAAFNKHEAVLQCAHHAYWMANNSYLNTIESTTRNIRLESIAVHNRLLSIEVKEDKVLTPVPRMQLIDEVDSNTDRQNNVKAIGSTHTTTTTGSAQDETTTITDSTQEDDGVTVSSSANQQMPTVTSKNGTNLNIPDVPTELPKEPVASKTNTKVTISSNTSPVTA